jgi:hypothetical protein
LPVIGANSKLILSLIRRSTPVWQQITTADVQHARHQLSLRRAQLVRRHAEELKDIEAQFNDIETFERVVAAFFEEYMSPQSAPLEPTGLPDERTHAA